MFITFEGPDGSGKTTAINKLVEYLNSQKIDFILTREPGSRKSPLGQELREIVLNAEYDISPMAEAILFTADRRQHLENVIWPALKQNKLVLCDRYFDSSFAYQGYARGLGMDKIISLNEIITDKTFPDITVYFDLPHDVAKSRLDNRPEEQNKLDKEGDSFTHKVHEGYHELIKIYKNRYRVIDAAKNPEDVFAQVKNLFDKEVINK